jgi:hypothetical protein
MRSTRAGHDVSWGGPLWSIGMHNFLGGGGDRYAGAWARTRNGRRTIARSVKLASKQGGTPGEASLTT